MTKNVGIEIRQAYAHESSVLCDIAFRAKQSNGYSESFMNACLDELTVSAKDISIGEYWVAESGGIQGFVCLAAGSNAYTGEIHSFFIEPAWQRRGIGKLLWQKIIERVKKKCINTLFLDSDPAAVPFYQALGFQIIGEVPSGSIAGRMLPHMEYRFSEQTQIDKYAMPFNET